jgi:GMP synthase (glutamine-hydrolysing)
MTDKKQVWAIQHIEYGDLGSFEKVLRERNFDIQIIQSQENDLSLLDASKPDLIMILGGPMSIYDVTNTNWVQREQAFVKQRIESQKPLFGICFGAQMIARALGAKAYEGPQGKEIGWEKIHVNEAGMQTPLRHLDGSFTEMMHWHSDTFDMPEGAELLASSDLYKKQAYRYGTHVFAMQCHPEVTEKKINIWCSKSEDDVKKAGKTVDEVISMTKQHRDTLEKQSALFFHEWLDGQGL